MTVRRRPAVPIRHSVASQHKTDRDGTVKLVTTGGVVAGLELIPREQDGRTVLVLDAGQHQYVFERVQADKPKQKQP